MNELNDNQKIVLRWLDKQYDIRGTRTIYEVFGRLWLGAQGQGDEVIPAKVKAAYNVLTPEELNHVGSYAALPW